MTEHTSAASTAVVPAKKRFIVLDALRGFAILGICLANFPEFALYTFLPDSVTAAMPAAKADNIVRYVQYLLVDGKFYTLFSLLFGIGFSLILAGAENRGVHGYRLFYRRMSVLLLIGLLHLMLLWSGDILMLYALLGMVLPVLYRSSNRALLMWAGICLILPIVADAFYAFFSIEPAARFHARQWELCAKYGITEDNFAYWLQQQDSYVGVLQFLVQGACERMEEFINGNRYFRVLGLFIIGFYIGRNNFYRHLDEKKALLKKLLLYGGVIGLPLSFIYAWSSTQGHPWGAVVHTILYTVSVFPLGMAYFCLFHLLYLRYPNGIAFRLLAAPGRMALSNYIGQSVMGIILFYGVGFGLGTQLGLSYVVLVALGVYCFQVVVSWVWFRLFRFGPLEWLWRMLTYGKVFGILKEK